MHMIQLHCPSHCDIYIRAKTRKKWIHYKWVLNLHVYYSCKGCTSGSIHSTATVRKLISPPDQHVLLLTSFWSN